MSKMWLLMGWQKRKPKGMSRLQIKKLEKKVAITGKEYSNFWERNNSILSLNFANKRSFSAFVGKNGLPLKLDIILLLKKIKLKNENNGLKQLVEIERQKFKIKKIKKIIKILGDDEKIKEIIQNKPNKRMYKLNNIISRQLSSHRRRLKNRELINKLNKYEWMEKLKKTKGYCKYCKRKIGIKNLTLDHIIPISRAPKGFVYTINEVQPICARCNLSKRDKIPNLKELKQKYIYNFDSIIIAKSANLSVMHR